jgi:hypothetical protein
VRGDIDAIGVCKRFPVREPDLEERLLGFVFIPSRVKAETVQRLAAKGGNIDPGCD